MSVVRCPPGHLICPYNKSHVIRTARMQFHLTKCLPNAGDTRFEVCPFNSTHLIPATEINNHKLNECPDRISLDTFLYNVEDTKPLFEVPNIEIESEENWEDVYLPYDPQKVLSEKKLLVLKQVVPPAERKKFNAEQRRKFNSMNDEPISTAKNNKSNPRPPNTTSMAQKVPAKKPEIKEEVQVLEQVQVLEEKIERVNINENEEFKTVVGKKNKKAPKKDEVKPKENQPKKNEQKVTKTQPNKNIKENVQIKKEEIKLEPMKENIAVVPKEDEFIVVTKKKNKRKH